ncbi:MAG: DNA-binding GntR family transcriptional regulator [Cognaticolwellia sp.]|jgi:DNA-binding GntR family transcriptional regulator
MLLYQKIRQYIATMIEQQPAMKKLPSERELQEQYKSTRITVREALMHLEVEGTIYRQNRKGWFICSPRLQWNPVNKVDFYQLASEQNFLAKTALVSLKTITAAGDIKAIFDNGDDDDQGKDVSLFEIYRVRSLDGRPVMVEEIYCRTERFEGLADKELEGSLTTIFNQNYGVEISSESSRIYVTALPVNKAAQLQLNSGASCLKIFRQRFNKDNELIDYNIEYWVHGAIEINVTSSS